MSDPPGIPLYYDMGVDKDGLHCYRTVQGTNSVEGNIHMPLRRMFGSLHASPELSDALLCNSHDRRNTTVCWKFYLSLIFVSHSLSGWPFQLYWKKMEWSSWYIQIWWNCGTYSWCGDFTFFSNSWNFVNSHCYKRIFWNYSNFGKNCWRTWFWKKKGTFRWRHSQTQKKWERNLQE